MLKEVKKVVLLEKHRLVSEGLAFLLNEQRELEVVAKPKTGEELFKTDSLPQSDLVIIDLKSPGTKGMAVLNKLNSKFPDKVILIYTDLKDMKTVQRCMGLGVRGYILKSDSSKTLVAAIRSVLLGKIAISPEIHPCLNKDVYLNEYESILKNLTPREIEVMSLVSDGLSSRLIAERLSIARRTIDKHRENIKVKLNGKTVAELVFVARHYRLL